MTGRLRFPARLALAACLVGGPTARVAAALGDPFHASVQITPSVVRVGQTARYSGTVTVVTDRAIDVRWVAPKNDDDFSWGRSQVRHTSGADVDTFRIETTVQAFRLGRLTVPGLGFVDRAGAPRTLQRLPVANLIVVPVIPASDTTADLRPVRGPIRAPWWEVVPWAWVAGVLLAGSALIALWHLRRRRTVVTWVPAARHDPVETALGRLRELRERKLPEAGEFGAHALELTFILRRFLEDTTTRLRPGYTTGDLARRLEEESVPAGEAMVLVSLLKVLDRVKFARAPFTAIEARKSEDAVESFVRRRRPPAAPSAEAA
jgi:hypothetical protein